jgi:hypothetical protein
MCICMVRTVVVNVIIVRVWFCLVLIEGCGGIFFTVLLQCNIAYE